MVRLRVVGSLVVATVAVAAVAPATAQDLDSFMARVLERRDEAWRTLHDYVLDEREQFQILGPGDVPLHGERREYTWYVRDGFLIRSPVRANGVELKEAERREYEAKWLDQEQKRERRAAERKAKEAEKRAAAGKRATADARGAVEPGRAEARAAEGAGETGKGGADPSLDEFVGTRGEPRFISEAYFLRFKFEPGNYYLAGRERLDGREVLRIEYYPSKLFGDEDREKGEESEKGDKGDKSEAEKGEKGGEGAKGAEREKGVKAGQSKTDRRRDRGREHEEQLERDIDRKMNKASQVTLWVDPAEHQIVRYTFENMDFGFLPGRWLVRVDDAVASMTMARVLDGVWLPSRISMSAGLSLANGGYRFEYGREFFDYRKAEVGARIRSYVPRQP